MTSLGNPSNPHPDSYRDQFRQYLALNSPIMPTYTNRLAAESSPYLLQHAHNPVDWYPWGEEAFDRARREDKPLLVSIGYAACHWCHVMERESFENPDVAALMNEHFVNIKVDREERPDVDGIYMDAVQALSGSGGWPLNVFLTPDGRPFYGGTYFPPARAFNRAAWPDVLQAVAAAYRDKKDEIESQAQTLTEHLRAANAFGSGASGFTPSPEAVREAFRAVMKSADRLWGGFGKAPKFPQTFVITFLLRYAHLTGDEDARDQALLSLDRMAMGGLYDQIGGGFARYSTDTEWLVPHFEKMLYDNALMVSTLAEAYQLTGEERYQQAIAETLRWAERELQHPQGGFYSALDADSEGEEGKFYVWDYSEVVGLLGEDADLFCAYYDITPRGNWEGKNIPWVIKPLATFARDRGVEEEELQKLLHWGRERLLEERAKRVRPGLDDKVLLSWNALMNLAYSKAYAATGEEAYRHTAERNMTFLLDKLAAEGEGLFHHSWKDGVARHHGFLEDYSYLVAALLELATITAEPRWLERANLIAETVLKHFKDEASPFFFFTPDFQTDVLLRKKEIYDGATPAGNSVMALNLYRLSILLEKSEWRTLSEELLRAMGAAAVQYPTSFGVWLLLLQERVYGTKEIAVVGTEAPRLTQEVLRLYLPHKVMMASESENDQWPLLRGKKVGAKTLIFLCENYACRQPVFTIEELQTLM